jgi:hypothetical protein
MELGQIGNSRPPFRLPFQAIVPTISLMNAPDPINGRHLFVDGIVRPVFLDDASER